jgi:hypothetical protein
MAKQYKAVTLIRHGVGEEQTDGTVRQTGVVVFEPGDVVTGLPKAAMKELWDAGVLEQVEVADAKDKAAEEKEAADKAAQEAAAKVADLNAKTADEKNPFETANEGTGPSTNSPPPAE